jgi:hypothetical protein
LFSSHLLLSSHVFLSTHTFLAPRLLTPYFSRHTYLFISTSSHDLLAYPHLLPCYHISSLTTPRIAVSHVLVSPSHISSLTFLFFSHLLWRSLRTFFRAFIVIAAQSLRNRYGIALHSSRNRFAFIAELLCVHCGTALRSLRNRFDFIAELLCVHCGTALTSLRNRFDFIAEPL